MVLPLQKMEDKYWHVCVGMKGQIITQNIYFPTTCSKEQEAIYTVSEIVTDHHNNYFANYTISEIANYHHNIYFSNYIIREIANNHPNIYFFKLYYFCFPSQFSLTF